MLAYGLTVDDAIWDICSEYESIISSWIFLSNLASLLFGRTSL